MDKRTRVGSHIVTFFENGDGGLDVWLQSSEDDFCSWSTDDIEDLKSTIKLLQEGLDFLEGRP